MGVHAGSDDTTWFWSEMVRCYGIDLEINRLPCPAEWCRWQSNHTPVRSTTGRPPIAAVVHSGN
jgi:hypothetical protein